MPAIGEEAFEILFRNARSQNKWQDRPVSAAVLRQLFEVVKWGPTSANGFPMRVVFLTTDEAKEKLAAVAMPGNREKIRSAPVTAIVGYDTRFYELMPTLLFPHNPGMAEMFASNQEVAEVTAFRNSTLQGAYLLLAARGFGLDCGPMSGFDNKKCDEIFFPDGRVKSNFLCGIGYGDPSGLYDRLPRPKFDQVCRVE